MKSWTALTSGLWLCCWFATTRGFMDMSYFDKEIAPNCYGRDDSGQEYPNGQKVPIPNTLEAFLTLVEKIEHAQQNSKLFDIVKILLVSFRYDDLLYNKNEKSFGSRSTAASTAFKILKEIFNYPSQSTAKLNSDVLTQDERCALFFMISHTVNGTIRPVIDTILPDTNNENAVIKHPREQGVVMLNSNVDSAFALGKVLLGLFSGGYSTTDIDSKTVYRNLFPKEEMDESTFSGDKINLLYAATFGDLISASKELMTTSQKQNQDIFLFNGKWNDDTCPTEYQLNAIEDNYPLDYLIHTTYSSIRGAIDGYMLGNVIAKITKAVPEIRLSQVLRGYYGVRELSLTGSDNIESISWCFRQRYKDATEELKSLAISYDKLYTVASGKLASVTNIRDGIFEVFKRISDREGPIIRDSFENSKCDRLGSTTTECDTDRDIIAIVDYKTTAELQETQRRIIGELASGMQMSMYGSSASVYTNLRSFGGSYLDNIINGTKYSGCASCALKQNTRTGGIKNEAEVFRDLNRTLCLMEEETTTEERSPGVPAKVVLYFNYGGNINNDDWQLKNAINDFQRQHRDARVLAFGSKKENLKIFVQNSDDIETVPVLTELTATKLKEKVCKTPALFQYKNCDERTDADEMENMYDGFISPNTIQYWAMYPKYFLKSYRIKLTFRAVTGVLKVCFSRYYGDIFDQKEPRGDCKDTSTSSGNSENTVEFYVRNPCHKYNVDNCYPFYFYIEEKSRSKSSGDNSYCKDERCKTIDQNHFQFTHQGISCNTGSFLTCTTSTIFYATVAAIFWLFSTAKSQ